jgi:hypothetical protein
MRNAKRPINRAAIRRLQRMPASSHRNYRPAERFAGGTQFWDRPHNPARLLTFLVRRIISFHDSDPLLAQPPVDVGFATGSCPH